MNPIESLKKKGISGVINVIYSYKIDIIICKLMSLALKNKKLKDFIIIESHNDFDCNGGAFYNFLIQNGYNKKYRIIWLLKHPERKPKVLPENVECYPLFKPSIKKDYYNVIGKYFTSDCYIPQKYHIDQRFIYFSHGCGGLKKTVGLTNIPDYVDYIIMQSESYAPIQAEQFSLSFPNKRIVYLGFPTDDTMHNADGREIKKVTNKVYRKTIIWMPTFRKGGGVGRNDSNKEQPLGIPLLNSLTEYTQLNNRLKENDSLLIIKIHPMQDLSNLKIKSMSNITVLTGDDVKNKNIDNYRLLPCTDAMISDYSGVAYEYLKLDKPIAYVLEDMKDYKLGFVVEDINSLLAGPKIYRFEDLLGFVDDVVSGNDKYENKRHQVRDFIYKYCDGNSCQRIADFMGLKI